MYFLVIVVDLSENLNGISGEALKLIYLIIGAVIGAVLSLWSQSRTQKKA